jgi:ubiquinone biosynthesis monooxygenase Coq7
MTGKRVLPGDLPLREYLERAVRVNHAGEYGAARIYQGQLAVLKDEEAVRSVREMERQEREHLAYFEKELAVRGVRPSALHPFWHVAGYALGAATALLGKEAAMACTAAVEEVIDGHYREQMAALEGTGEDELAAAIAKFREDELRHRDEACAHGAERAPAYRLLTGAIKLASRLAIAAAKRV